MSAIKTIATHSGSFHADDVFGVAVLMRLFPDHQLQRTRREELLAAADFTVDVGGEWDAARGRFDHHQRGFAGVRPPADVDGVPLLAVGYASAGLVWSAYGVDYVRALAAQRGFALDATAVADIAAAIDADLVRYIDMVDTGQAGVARGMSGLSALMAQLNTNWMEEQGLDATARAQLQETRFRDAMAITARFLDHAIIGRISQLRSRDIVRQSERLLGGRVLYLREGGVPWTQVVINEMPEVLLVIYPDSDGDQFQLKTVPIEAGSFVSKIDLPRAWAGLRDDELAAVSGVADSVFCHLNLFICGARSFAGVLRLAELALQ